MKALTIGGAMIDTIVSIAPDRDERKRHSDSDSAFLRLELGKKREALDISVHCGGGAINAAVCMARLGLETSLIVKLGRDFRADIIRELLVTERISTAYVICNSQLPTGASVLISGRDSNTAVITFRGANTTLTSHDLPMAAFAVDLVYVSGLSDQSADCLGQIVGQAKAAGALVAANPGIRQLTTRHDAFCAALANIDILAVNKSEAAVLLPWLSTSPAFTHDKVASVDADAAGFAHAHIAGEAGGMTMSRFCRLLNARGPRWIVVTDGKDGAYIGTAAGLMYCPAAEAVVVGTAGAGDAFNATFAAALVTGATTDDAAIAASLNSASVVAHLDTQSGLLTHAALTACIAERGRSLHLRHWPYR